LALVSWYRDPVRRLAKFNGEKNAELVTGMLLKDEIFQEGTEGLKEFWRSLGIDLRMFGKWLQQSELPIAVGWLIPGAIVCSLLVTLTGYLAHAPISSLPLLALVGAVIPLALVSWRRKRRLKLFSQQLPDALDLMASALRSGNTLQSSLQVIADEMMPPLSKEFGQVSESIRLGIPVEQAMDEMAQRVPNPDLEFFVTAVSMQRQTGGDLAEILDKISWLVRERFYIQGQVQALTGEARMSGLVLTGLPLILLVIVYSLNPTYVMLLFTEPLGQKMLGGALVLQVLGAICIRHIVNIKI
jgi:tight adherence protein B